jgi:uronate dehydrogenase
MNYVLMTGAAGGIGTRFRDLIKGRYPRLRLSDLKRPDDLDNDEEFIEADLADMAAVERMVDGVEGIIHFGGYSVEGPWDAIHQANIVGLYNLFEAARQAGVKRVVFASSNHAVGFYRRTRKIGVNTPVRPDSRYGISKAFGEAVGAYYADKFGMRVMCIRIGNVDDKPIDLRRLAIWVHPEDLAQLVRIGLTHPDLHYEIVYGASHNERAWWDNETAFKLGYQPKHHGEDHAAHALNEQQEIAADPVGDLFQGGTFCAQEFDGDLKRI